MTPQIAQDRQVEQSDEEQETSRDAGPDDRRGLPIGREPRLQACGNKGNRDRGQDDHARMAEGEPEADRDRPLRLLHELARDIVDRRNVVWINGMTQPEDVSEQRRCEQRRLFMEGDEGPERETYGHGEHGRVECRDTLFQFAVETEARDAIAPNLRCIHNASSAMIRWKKLPLTRPRRLPAASGSLP